jgi:hypothetical protein
MRSAQEPSDTVHVLVDILPLSTLEVYTLAIFAIPESIVVIVSLFVDKDLDLLLPSIA